MFAFCQDMPGATMEQQQVLQAAMPEGALEGCVVHVVGEYDGGVRMIDVWTDEASYRRFQREVLWPLLDRMMPQLATVDVAAPAPFVVSEVTGTALGSAA
ncbi:MAG: hypothetical protein U0R76_17875 [Candidatus Nanopelagicales bacterium]